MDVNLTVSVPALEKLIDHTASGIGSVAHSLLTPLLSPWQAKQQAQADAIAAEGQAHALLLQANARSTARQMLIDKDAEVSGELTIAEAVTQRIQFQERKRLLNVQSVVAQAAEELGDTLVENSEPDHDWTARFFNDVQDVSSAQMQLLWARVLAGEVRRRGSTTLRTLGILKNLDQVTADRFRTLCSLCFFLYMPDGGIADDARVCSLGGNAAQNCLADYGLGFGTLNRLNEHGLVISDYNSWIDYVVTRDDAVGEDGQVVRFPFVFQGTRWDLELSSHDVDRKRIRISGVALTWTGRELAKVVEVKADNRYRQALERFFRQKGVKMVRRRGVAERGKQD